MLSLLGVSNVFEYFWSNLLTRLQIPAVIIAICLAAAGVALGILARRIARATNKSNTIQENDRTMITCKTIAIIFLFASLLIFILK